MALSGTLDFTPLTAQRGQVVRAHVAITADPGPTRIVHRLRVGGNGEEGVRFKAPPFENLSLVVPGGGTQHFYFKGIPVAPEGYTTMQVYVVAETEDGYEYNVGQEFLPLL